jgi:Uma2 family endonuclease
MSLPAWATDPSSLLITEQQYQELPGDLAHSIEVVDGRVMFWKSPTPDHQRVSLNLAWAIKSVKPAEPCTDVLQDTDMWYVQANSHASNDGRRFTMRRPDISVFWCLKPGERLTSADAFAVIEITSANSETDFNDKKAEYASQRIPLYLIVILDGAAINSIEEYRLDWSGRNYQLVNVHRGALAVELAKGFEIDIAFSTLEV